jgi:hypothetical protein
VHSLHNGTRKSFKLIGKEAATDVLQIKPVACSQFYVTSSSSSSKQGLGKTACTEFISLSL